jgi:hypothetical protein
MLKQVLKGIAVTVYSLMLTSDAFPQIGNHIYICRNGNISILSDAPLELIKAANRNLSGVLNTNDRSFSFQVPVKDFEGFNSSLQRVHFNEDYMETELFPYSTFKGKIIEEIDFGIPGEYKIRAKGKLNIHGVEIDRIVRCDLIITNLGINVNAVFTVFIADHNISIPSILNQKIAREIKVDVKFTFIPQEQGIE